MDFNGIVEGTTVYLQVHQPGALLYFGDGHALQGDGELNGNALEIVVNEVADRNAGIVVRLAKDRLLAIPRKTAEKGH